jgi:hypothetical protein
MDFCSDWHETFCCDLLRDAGLSVQSDQLTAARGMTGPRRRTLALPRLNPVKVRLRRMREAASRPRSIFLSHVSADRALANEIRAALRARRLQVWMADRDVRPGDNFQEAIVHAIRAAKVMLVVFTAHANKSDEIKKELALAARHHLTVIPLRFENIAPNAALSYELVTRQWIDLFADRESAMQDLITRLIDLTAPQRDIEAVASGRRQIDPPAGRTSKRPVERAKDMTAAQSRAADVMLR